MSSLAIHVVPTVATDAMQGKFPLISDSTKKQWELLISELENNMTAFSGTNITFGGSSHIQPKTSVKGLRLILPAVSECGPDRNGTVQTD